MRVVIDTNILVSAVIKPSGIVGAVLDSLRHDAYIILYSQSLLDEVVDVLKRPRIRDKYGVTDEDIKTVIALIMLRGEHIIPIRKITVCRDPKDDLFLEIAVAGAADVIVTGDKDLLVLHPFEDMPILAPSAFLQRLADKST